MSDELMDLVAYMNLSSKGRRAMAAARFRNQILGMLCDLTGRAVPFRHLGWVMDTNAKKLERKLTDGSITLTELSDIFHELGYDVTVQAVKQDPR